MHKYRTHNCSQLQISNVDDIVKLSGWIHSKRDHGGLMFIDLRDQFGKTQIVIDLSNKIFNKLENLRLESVITITGKVIKRSESTVNKKISTGEIEVDVNDLQIISESNILPLQVASDDSYGDEVRFKNRFLDLRREKMKNNILLRSDIIQFIRRKMTDLEFKEFQTPILTASSPEGARDFIVPSRLHKGRFYALPQAPQLFKQLIMTSGFDKYFQIAPCFRDEDARADRSPGEFYQLDIEMAFCTQEDVFSIVEKVIYETFQKFSDKKVTNIPFPRIPYEEAIRKYGSDKPDLRNPLIIIDVTEFFLDSRNDFKIFKKIIENGGIVSAIIVNVGTNRPRSFFDKLNKWAQQEGASGLGYIDFELNEEKIVGKGPIANNIDSKLMQEFIKTNNIKREDAIFFISGERKEVSKFSGIVRTKIAQELNMIKNEEFNFCWIVDFPMYEKDELSGKIIFSHNPFSMPQGGMDSLLQKDPLEVKAYQYDIVCNGIELSSGAIRNHKIDIMTKAFEIAGYPIEKIQELFPSLFKAFQYGAPPHGGIAPGIDRLVMLLSEEVNIREVIMFPMNQKAEDLLMGAPNEISKQQLKELKLIIDEDYEE